MVNLVERVYHPHFCFKKWLHLGPEIRQNHQVHSLPKKTPRILVQKGPDCGQASTPALVNYTHPPTLTMGCKISFGARNHKELCLHLQIKPAGVVVLSPYCC